MSIPEGGSTIGVSALLSILGVTFLITLYHLGCSQVLYYVLNILPYQMKKRKFQFTSFKDKSLLIFYTPVSKLALKKNDYFSEQANGKISNQIQGLCN